ncbi:MAG: hypothetical protein R2696_12835 [Microthrixaceae bacterium]|nr:hypothetical protein [Microthrixaceae bacterium]MCO5306239.1 hypothetical protein [Microthrixaceae bacterium]
MAEPIDTGPAIDGGSAIDAESEIDVEELTSRAGTELAALLDDVEAAARSSLQVLSAEVERLRARCTELEGAAAAPGRQAQQTEKLRALLASLLPWALARLRAAASSGRLSEVELDLLARLEDAELGPFGSTTVQ